MAYLLDRQGPASRADLEALFEEYRGESGRRRFEDDKAALRRGAIPIRTVEHAGSIVGYELRREDYELPTLELTEDERVALNLAMRSVDFSTVPWARMAGTKLGLDDGAPIATMAELPGLHLLPGLHEAVRHRRRVCFSYRGELRVLDPWGLVLKNGRWYVPGFDHDRGGVRVFRIDRIDAGTLEVAEGDAAFEIPADVVPSDLVPGDALVMQPGTHRVARVRADREVASLLVPSFEPGPDHTAQDEVVVEVEVTYPDAFVSWVLALGELVVVEDPPDLRDAVVARLEELAG
jgi:predicted DNA-binding transcriptional regulator YafY